MLLFLQMSYHYPLDLAGSESMNFRYTNNICQRNVDLSNLVQCDQMRGHFI
jgi:hypothetical protein